MAVWYWAVMLRTCIFVKLTSYFEGICTYVLLYRGLLTLKVPQKVEASLLF